MFDPQPIQILCYDKSFSYKGVLALPNEVTLIPRFNAPGECTFTVDADVPRIADLTADGGRVVVRYRWRRDQPYRTLLSGTCHEVTGSGPQRQAVREISVRDDFHLFSEMLAWPQPDKALDQQKDDTNFKLSGPAETVIRTVTGAAATRLGVPLTLETDEERGSTIRVNARFAALSDLFFASESEEVAAVGTGGLGVRIIQLDDERVLQFWEPATYPRTLTEASGVVQDGSFTLVAPEVTRVIVGGGGEGTAREFRQYVDSAAESAFGVKREKFVDARDLQPTDEDNNPNPDFEDEMAARGTEALAEGAGTAGLDLTLSESDVFKFGNAFELGDEVTVDVSGSGPITATVSEVEIQWSAGEGLVVTPRVGTWDSSPDAELIRIVSKTAKALRALQRSY